VEKRYGYGVLGPSVILRLPIALIRTYSESRLWRLGPGTRIQTGHSLLDVGCMGDALPDGQLLCTAFDGTRTRILALEADRGSVTAIGMIDGQFHPDAVNSRGWLTGWSSGRPTAIRLATREALRPPSVAHEFVNLVAPAESVIATATMMNGRTRVRLYPLTARTGTLTRAE
jgi:hypothetical protein